MLDFEEYLSLCPTDLRDYFEINDAVKASFGRYLKGKGVVSDAGN